MICTKDHLVNVRKEEHGGWRSGIEEMLHKEKFLMHAWLFLHSDKTKITFATGRLHGRKTD